jgi:hypothetical protein
LRVELKKLSNNNLELSRSQPCTLADGNLAAQIFQRPIILVPFHPEDAHNPWGTIEFHPRDPSNLEPINLMWFSERGFFSPHFQSTIRPINDIPFEVPQEQEQEQVQVQHATQVQAQEQEIDNLISISLSMDFGTSLLSMPSLCNSSVIAPPQLHSTAMSITNESKKERKKEKIVNNHI